ncbi:unnamed protein product [Enterobius vermicularis]|uniref:NAAA-beta domain-containing protein n=1 Tax=Enterobius vermicularis TaxID=51028 RepID=A0A0N4VE46_ENTVE|nr:unnamed protein product [Enterobius vermicularis]
MRILCVITVSLLFGLAYCQLRKPKLYKVDLDKDPKLRWKEVIDDHLIYAPAIKQEASRYFKTPFGTILCWLLEKVVLLFPDEYAKEMEGIANISGLEYCEVIGLNILHDITNYNNLIGNFANKLNGCTSIVGEDDSGRILHGRNLDFQMTELLKNLSVVVEFTRNDTVAYTGITFAYFVGLLTAQKPFAYTFSLNARRTGWYIATILMQIYTGFRMPVEMGIRMVCLLNRYLAEVCLITMLQMFETLAAEMFESANNYEEASEYLQNMLITSPCYFILGGTKAGEGMVITRFTTRSFVYTLRRV